MGQGEREFGVAESGYETPKLSFFFFLPLRLLYETLRECAFA
jgi:hypothetical protein